MFSGVTSRLQSDIDTIKLVLDTHEGLRSLVFAQSPTKQANEQNVDQAETPSELAKTLNEIRRVAPSKLSWQIYDRCAAFTRLYAVFEQFVEDLATDYLRMLPGLFPRYEDLPMNITTQHRIGIGQILLKLGKDGPFRELEERNIIRDLSHGLSGNPNYTLLRDAFLIDPQNYRAEPIAKLFRYLGFEDCWPWVEKHPLMVEFMQRERDANETPKTVLGDFVDYRNEASHTAVGDIVATEGIKSFADFVAILGETLAQLVMKYVLRRKEILGEAIVVGRVVHKFSDGVIGALMSAGTVAIGDELFIMQSRLCCRSAVRSIQIEQIPHERLDLKDDQEIGIRLSVEASEGAHLMRLGPVQLAMVPETIPEPISPDDFPLQPVPPAEDPNV